MKWIVRKGANNTLWSYLTAGPVIPATSPQVATGISVQALVAITEIP